MNPYVKGFIRGLMAAIIAGGGAYLASDGSEKSLWIAGVTAAIAFAKDIESQLGPSPTEPR